MSRSCAKPLVGQDRRRIRAHQAEDESVQGHDVVLPHHVVQNLDTLV